MNSSAPASKIPDVHTIYVSPTGKRCVFEPKPEAAGYYFRYLDKAELNGEGFPLSWANFRLMRVHPRQRLG